MKMTIFFHWGMAGMLLVIWGPFLARAQPPADLVGGFAADMEGWLASDGATTLTWQSTGGADAGYLEGEGPGGAWSFVSPGTWAGDWSGYAAMKFDLAIPSRHYADEDVAGIVVIEGLNGETMTWTGPTPLFTWSHYEISFTADAFDVDEATFAGIMADVVEVRILAEYAGSSTESVGLDEVLITSTPITVHGDALVERFTSAVKTGYNVNGWKPVDDVTLDPRPEEGRPFHGLYCDDWQDGRTFKVESPDGWAGDWRGFTQLSFDMRWHSTGGGTAGPEVTGDETIRLYADPDYTEKAFYTVEVFPPK